LDQSAYRVGSGWKVGLLTAPFVDFLEGRLMPAHPDLDANTFRGSLGRGTLCLCHGRVVPHTRPSGKPDSSTRRAGRKVPVFRTGSDRNRLQRSRSWLSVRLPPPLPRRAVRSAPHARRCRTARARTIGCRTIESSGSCRATWLLGSKTAREYWFTRA